MTILSWTNHCCQIKKKIKWINPLVLLCKKRLVNAPTNRCDFLVAKAGALSAPAFMFLQGKYFIVMKRGNKNEY